MDAVILAGGQGTRLKSVSGATPKALVPIYLGKPFLHYLLLWLQNSGVHRVIISLGYRADLFEAYLVQAEKWYDLEILTVVEPKPLGTGGAVRLSLASVRVSDPFLVVNGDSLSSLDLGAMAVYWGRRTETACMSVVELASNTRYGYVQISDGRVLRFEEKRGKPGPATVNSGCYILPHEAFDGQCDAFSMETDILPSLAERNSLCAFTSPGPFIDIGIPADFRRFGQIVNHVLPLK